MNLDGTVDARDIDVITDYRAGKFDINGDGRWTEEDAIRMGEVVQYFNLHITALDRFKADLNGNKEIDEGDINTLSQLVPVFTSGDLNGNGFVDDDDLDKVQRMVDFLRFDLPAPKVIEGWDLDNDGKMDTTFVQNPLYRADVNHDGVITLEDKQIVQTLLNQMIDINGDQVFDQDDASRILEVMESANLLVTDEDVLTADMDGDGRITGVDIRMLNDNFQLFNRSDVNGDGKTDGKDVEFIQNLFNFINTRQIMSYEAVKQADLNEDGVVDDGDKSIVLSVLENLSDVNGDGFYDQKDVVRLDQIMSAINLNVTPKDLKVADVNGDSIVDATDVTLLEGAIALFSNRDNLDVNRDGAVNDKDVAEILKIYEAITAQKQISLDEMARMDMNRDGVVDDTDVEEILTLVKSHVDVNGDGLINNDDVKRIGEVREFLGLKITDEEKVNADINKDGFYDDLDILELRRRVRIYKRADIDGLPGFTQGDIDYLQSVVDFVRDIQSQFRPEQIIRADFVKDDWIDDKDRAELARVVSHVVDVNLDGLIDKNDVSFIYTVIRAMEAGIARAEKDINGDGVIWTRGMPLPIQYASLEVLPDEEREREYDKIDDVKLLKESIAKLKQFDVNEDGVVDEKDINLLLQIVSRAFVDGAVYAREFLRSDLDENDRVDGDDLTILMNKIGSYSVRKDAVTALSRFGFLPSERTIYATENNSYADFTMTLSTDGLYDVGLSAKSFNSQVLPEYYQYKFEVYVDNVYRGQFNVPGDRLNFKEGLVPLDLTAGRHVVRYVWVNDQGAQTNLQINEVFARSRYDLDQDGYVNEKDVALLKHVREDFPCIDVNKDGLIDIYDETKLVELFRENDKDKDGKVDLADIPDTEAFKAVLALMDINKDKLINEDDTNKLNAI
ncbi:MAG: hypothetical protein UY82_C0063G0002, partial [Candidatus Uhrbacteria bacterium GW2011_GWC2_53_7]